MDKALTKDLVMFFFISDLLQGIHTRLGQTDCDVESNALPAFVGPAPQEARSRVLERPGTLKLIG